MRTGLLLLLGTLMPLGARAQPAPACLPGNARGVIQGANVQATVYNTGNLFFRSSSDALQYIVPLQEGLGRSPIYSAALWLSGTVGSEVRVTGAQFQDFMYRPGLTGPDGVPPTYDECQAEDRIYTVSVTDVERYNATGEVTRDLAEWPVRLGARVADGDGVPDNYNLTGGDRPMLSGDVTAFWAMSDLGTAPGRSDLIPVGVDVRVEAFAFRLAPAEALETATFYRYTITNRSGQRIDSLRAALWADFDLGDAGDDYIGTDTTLAMNYVYNADNDDGTSAGYGENPPAVGILLLDSPPGDDRPRGALFSSHILYNGGCSDVCDLSESAQYINRLRGRFNDGALIHAYGSGYQSPGPVTTFFYPGDPVTDQFWSLTNTDNQGTNGTAGNIRGVITTAATTLDAGETASYLFGVAYGRGTSNLNSVDVLRRNARTVHNAHEIGRLDARATAPPPSPDPPPLALGRPAPNPFADETVLRLVGTTSGTRLRVRVVDVLGRVVDEQTVDGSATGVRLGRGLAPGVYVVEVAGDGFTVPFPIVKTR